MDVDRTAQVLCVDDDEMTRDLFGRYLTLQGLSSVLAGDGAQALKLLEDQTNQIKLVFLDLALPYMDGYHVAAEILAHKQWADIPIVVVTAHCEPKVLKNLKELGVTEVITKPFHPRRLRDALVAHGILD